ncbi:MAG: GH92 family glycosyl hydrolase [Actinobacteria bacterium]|nr:GH92 family glycosyl hydrolase [Actinomycetota bacterium]MCL6105289.1 GH92 family glycosyl hydrolase [Actinomycetota bacterium]
MSRKIPGLGVLGVVVICALVGLVAVFLLSWLSTKFASPSLTIPTVGSDTALVKNPANLVNPLIGTGSTTHITKGSYFAPGTQHIDTFPGASMPFGMIQWSPDTPSRPDGGGYYYKDSSILGFSLTHVSGPGAPMGGDIPILPTTGALDGDPQFTEMAFSQRHETAKPGYYSVQLGCSATPKLPSALNSLGFEQKLFLESKFIAKYRYGCKKGSDQHGIDVRLSVTKRTGIGVFVYPKTTRANLLFKVSDTEGLLGQGSVGEVSIVGSREIVGSTTALVMGKLMTPYTLYFVAVFDRPFSSFGTWHQNHIVAYSTSTGVNAPACGAYLTFNTTEDRQVKMKVGISYVSEADAVSNLTFEDPGWSFSKVARDAWNTWDNLLKRVDIAGGTHNEQVTFYTALYHSLLDPTTFSDVNGSYMGFVNPNGFSAKVEQASGYTQYTNFSGWDIYRDELPLLALIVPNEASDMMHSLVEDATQGGWLPKWPSLNSYTGAMGGDSASPIIADAYAFGARDFPLNTALSFMLKGATVSTPSFPGLPAIPTGMFSAPRVPYIERPGLSYYQKQGWIPNFPQGYRGYLIDDSASVTLEYAIDDASLAFFAKDLGSIGVYKNFITRAQNWHNLINSTTKYIQPRDANGSFPKGAVFHRYSALSLGFGSLLEIGHSGQSGFQEGNVYQYEWDVPFNLAGLVHAIGGEGVAFTRLGKLFQHLNAGPYMPYYWAGNEPDIGAPWVYNFIGKPYMTQQIVHRIMAKEYFNAPGGLPGNDDLGAMSSWYVWAAMGLYPEIPGVSGLVVSSPLFSRIVVDVPTGYDFKILAAHQGPYIQAAWLGKTPFPASWITLGQLTNHTLAFDLGTSANISWGSKKSDLPPSVAAGLTVGSVAKASSDSS